MSKAFDDFWEQEFGDEGGFNKAEHYITWRAAVYAAKELIETKFDDYQTNHAFRVSAGLNELVR